MNPRQRVYEMLMAAGARLKRHKKHNVWELPGGKNFVQAATPSDHRSDLNNLTDLKHTLGIVNVPKAAVEGERKERREKCPPKRRPVIHAAPINSVFADKLQVSGVIEASLRERLADVEGQLALATARALAAERKVEGCWMCQLAGKWQRWTGSLPK